MAKVTLNALATSAAGGSGTSSSSIAAEGRYNVVVPLRRKPHPLRDIFVEWLAGSLSK